MHRDNRCMYMAHVGLYFWFSVYVGVCGNVCCVATVTRYSDLFGLGVLKCVVLLYTGCDGYCVLCLYCDA